MRILKVIVSSGCLFLAACAGNRTTTTPPTEYVEIDNPAFTMSPNAPATIWVPRSYVESGVPRGGEVLKKGAGKVVEGFRQSPRQAQPTSQVQQPAAAAAVPLPSAGKTPVAAQAPAPLKIRIALLEIGQNGLVQPLYENLRRSSIGVMLDLGQTAFLAQYATITDQTEKGKFAKRLQHDYNANIVIFVTVPDGVEAGKAITAELYDAMGGGLLRRFDSTIPPYAGKDQAARDAAVAAVLAAFTENIKELVALLPWYGRITEVEGNRAYIAAGKEAGLCVGQLLKIHRGGRFVEGLGFAPGEQVGTLVVNGFVGPNGSFGVIREGQGIQAADVVSVE